MAKGTKQPAPADDLLLIDKAADSVPLHVVTERTYPRWLETQDASTRAWLKVQRFQPKAGRSLVLPGKSGAVAGTVVGAADPATLWNFVALTFALPKATYRLELPRGANKALATTVALGWAKRRCKASQATQVGSMSALRARSTKPCRSVASVVVSAYRTKRRASWVWYSSRLSVWRL